MSSACPIAEVRDAAKVYERGGSRVAALTGVTLAVEKGEFLGVMGPSGSGKSTLLHILGCLARPTSGSCFLEGREVSGLGDRELSRLRAERIGFVFQTFSLIPQCSALENVAMPFLYHSAARKEALLKAGAALDRVGLWERRDHRPTELSGGEMQRVAIARALAGNPSLILADEPTGNLDPVSAQGVLDVLTGLNKQGATIVLVTHDQKVSSRCGRVARLRAGRLCEEGAP